MEEKEKKPWRPPEATQLPDPIAFAMQGFERFGLPKERLIPPLQTFDRVMQHSAFTENRWWENARQVTATASSEEQWRRVSIERARCLGDGRILMIYRLRVSQRIFHRNVKMPQSDY